MPSILPLYPRIILGVLDPLAMTYLALQIYFAPSNFLASQSSSSPDHSPIFSANSISPLSPSILTALSQLANVYLLIGVLSVIICHFITDAKIVKGYFVLIALGDLGHIFSVYVGMGGWQGGFGEVGKWGAAEWMNVSGALFGLINKVGTSMGLFGQIGNEERDKRSGGKKIE